MKLLVAEDNPDGQVIMGRYLERRGHQVRFVSDGKACVSEALSGGYDIVFLDMNLPVLDGWRAAEKIRVQKTYEALPIIAITAHAMASDRAKCLAAGCSDYLSKPIDFTALSALLERYGKLGA